MIKFFRKIRQNLLTHNKFSKYLLYAFGEILLVVIGILIALQINNWNEDRKSQIQELNILENVKKGLAADSIYRQASKEHYESARNSMDHIINHMEKDLPYEDSLKYHFARITNDWGFRFDFSSYEELKSKGTGTISNESLRSNIITYYSYSEGWVTQVSKRYSDIIDDASKTLFRKHFDEMWNSKYENGELVKGEMVPIDYESLKKDTDFRFFLKTLRNQNYWLIENTTNNINEHLANISNEIDSEINRLKK